MHILYKGEYAKKQKSPINNPIENFSFTSFGKGGGGGGPKGKLGGIKSQVWPDSEFEKQNY